MPTFLPRRLLQLAARSMVALLLFAQGVMLAHACSPAEREAAFAVAGAAASAPCHEAAAAPATAFAVDERASCLSHCSTADQSPDTPQVVVHAMPAVALLTVPMATPEAAARGRDSSSVRPPSGDPPIAIRFQVFRI
jgi:hypothetical protein